MCRLAWKLGSGSIDLNRPQSIYKLALSIVASLRRVNGCKTNKPTAREKVPTSIRNKPILGILLSSAVQQV
jgi:hypothetical protein